MNKIIITILVFTLIMLLGINIYQTNNRSKREKIVIVKAEEVILKPEQYADRYAEQFGIDASKMKSVMHCESTTNINTRNGDGGLAHGILQFHKETWNYYEQKYFKKFDERLDYNSYQDQIKLASWMFSIGKGGQWSCY